MKETQQTVMKETQQTVTLMLNRYDELKAAEVDVKKLEIDIAEIAAGESLYIAVSPLYDSFDHISGQVIKSKALSISDAHKLVIDESVRFQQKAEAFIERANNRDIKELDNKLQQIKNKNLFQLIKWWLSNDK